MANFEFFRKNQKLILYTAGIFALLTFSISGPMMSFFGDLGSGGFRGASLRLHDGRRIYTTKEDQQIAQALANAGAGRTEPGGMRTIVPNLVPPLGDDKTTDGDRVEILAALRRLAIEYGIEASSAEVDKAVQHILDVWPKQDAQRVVERAHLAGMSGMSGDQYDLLLRESLRISTLLRLLSFAADTSDLELAQKLARDIKLLTMRVATLDKKQIEERLKAEPVSDEALQEWLAKLTEAEKAPYQDTNRVAVKAAGVKLADFDPAVFAAELKDKTYDDAAVEARYNLDKELYYRKETKEGEEPPADPYLPLAEVKEQVIRRMQAEDVLKAFVDKLRSAMGEHLEAAVAARSAASKDVARAKADQKEADAKLAEKPDDEALKTASEAAKARVEATEQAEKTAAEAVDAARRAFDLEANLGKVTSAKLVVASIPEPTNADGLKDLPEFGPWNESWQATSLDLPGDISTKIQNTKNGVFLFQVLDVVKNPLKEFAKIKEQLQEDYYRKKADEEAKTKLAEFEAALERLARDAKKTEIEKVETEHTAAVAKRFDEWKAATEASIAEAKAKQQSLAADPESVAYKRWTKHLGEREAALAAAETKRQEFETEVRKQTDEKIEEVLKEAYRGVLETAAAEAGLTVETIGPYRKDADMQPRFQEDMPARARFLLSNPTVKDLAEGGTTDVLEDFTNRAHHLVVMEKIVPGSVADVTRRELTRERKSFEADRMKDTVAQSFTMQALEQGWGYQRTDAASNKAQPQSASAGGAKSGDSGAQKTPDDQKTDDQKTDDQKTGGQKTDGK